MRVNKIIRTAIIVTSTFAVGHGHTEPTLAPIVVRAEADYAGDFVNASSSIPSYQISTNLGRAIIAQRQLMARAAAASDVRCVPTLTTAAKATTSQSSATDRWLAANQLYTTVQGSAQIFGFLFNRKPMITNPADGKSYKGYRVTYADGGSETWYVSPNAQYSSVKLLDQPMSGSMKPGNGEVQPANCIA